MTSEREAQQKARAQAKLEIALALMRAGMPHTVTEHIKEALEIVKRLEQAQAERR